ncbi:S53 family peptidase [Streptacidiphilus jiangxiensis]|uniref:Subtilase family protein n=1 Tax=Streptacidiphilus jiangxiensis TaxID=235985 RepID=A0A1H7JNK1_STRJI|nr:S53 family peptidase [Streptacidiphilus jiangxiensis]SEK76209.1 Subtilase family protein [Streptacidiphilus jiangxiensis]
MGRSITRSRAVRTAAGITAGAAAVLAFSAGAPGTAVASGATSAALPKPIPASAGHVLAKGMPAVLPTSVCLSKIHIRCYTPQQYRKAYNLAPLYKSGINGKGRTIVIVDSFGSPTIQKDLNTFDKTFGLPGTNVDVRKWGNVPAWTGTSDQLGWAGETTLDVEYAHAIAPDAKIVLVETGVAETEGTTGFPEMMAAEKYAVDHHWGDVISQSFGATENTFSDYATGAASLKALRYAFADALKKGVTVLGASGDNGATDSTTAPNGLYTFRVNSWPSSDPMVTSVGGTQLTLDDNGNRTAPDQVWNDGYGAGGGGISGVFGRPFYQNGVAKVTGAHRGTPDISMTAAVNGAAWTYSSYDPKNVGWGLTGGTSEATPIFAGIVALADQKAGHDLGLLNPKLYWLGEHAAAKYGIVDVTKGNNSFQGVTGYNAVKGYDLSSGWGTINATLFVDALARR